MEPNHGSKNFKRSSSTFQLQSRILHSPLKKPKTHPNEFPSKVENKISNFTIKDLRVKRVYSPTLSNGVVKKNEELPHSTPPDADIFTRDYLGISLDSCPRSSNGCIADASYPKTDTKSVLKPCFKRKLFKAPGSIAYKRLLPYLLDNGSIQDDPSAKREGNSEKRANVESNLCNCPMDFSSANSDNKRLVEDRGRIKSQIENLTDKEQSINLGLKKLDGGNSSHISLNSDISCKPVMEEKSDKKVDCNPGEDQNLGSSVFSDNPTDIALAIDKKYDSYPRNKLFRNPLSQLKMLSRQGSIGYRRMLPFLKDLVKDNSEYCAPERIDCPGLEKGSETIHTQPPSLNCHNSIDKSESFLSYIKPGDENANTLSRTALTASSQTFCETEKCSMPAEVSDKLPTGDDKLPIPSKLQKQLLQFEQKMLDKCTFEIEPQLHSGLLLNDQAVTPLFPTANLECLTEEGSRLISKQSPITLEDCTRLTENVSDAKLPETDDSYITSSCVEVHIMPENPINIRKGILKRNPRGCRGNCSCLNCSSFRLHAERAFEFSRNQLQDAEEVALNLMKELLYLRDVLEKSADGPNDDAEYHLLKVKEASRKASEAESIAKDRFAQMNYELDIHCRITCSQRPNVRFSCDTEKRD